MVCERYRTASASGRSRRPAQARHSRASPCPSSDQYASSPVWVSSKSRSSRPVPKHDGHHPCREFQEKSRGSSSSKLLPHPGQARAVEVKRLAAAVGDPDPSRSVVEGALDHRA